MTAKKTRVRTRKRNMPLISVREPSFNEHELSLLRFARLHGFMKSALQAIDLTEENLDYAFWSLSPTERARFWKHIGEQFERGTSERPFAVPDPEKVKGRRRQELYEREIGWHGGWAASLAAERLRDEQRAAAFLKSTGFDPHVARRRMRIWALSHGVWIRDEAGNSVRAPDSGKRQIADALQDVLSEILHVENMYLPERQDEDKWVRALNDALPTLSTLERTARARLAQEGRLSMNAGGPLTIANFEKRRKCVADVLELAAKLQDSIKAAERLVPRLDTGLPTAGGSAKGGRPSKALLGRLEYRLVQGGIPPTEVAFLLAGPEGDDRQMIDALFKRIRKPRKQHEEQLARERSPEHRRLIDDLLRAVRQRPRTGREENR